MFTNDVQQVIVYIILAVVAVLIIVGIVRKLSSKNASCDMDAVVARRMIVLREKIFWKKIKIIDETLHNQISCITFATQKQKVPCPSG